MIALLSLAFSWFYLSGNDLRYIAGLGMTRIADNILKYSSTGTESYILIWAFNFCAALIFSLSGYFSMKRKSWAFITGMIIYALDGVLLMAYKEWPGFIFHIFSIIVIFYGWIALIDNKQPGSKK